MMRWIKGFIYLLLISNKTKKVFNKLKEKRKKALADKFALASNNWDVRHRVDFKLFK